LHRIREKEFPKEIGTGSLNNLKKQKNVSNLENTQAQMRKGVLEFCIMSIIARGEVYPSDIIGKMKEAKLIVVEGTLYPLLTRLKNAGLLSYKWVESTSGPPRKYYSITPIGENFLKELTTTWSELVEAVNQTAKNN
jgi:PadR family transcriptional regulator, regulatory protein PadR